MDIAKIIYVSLTMLTAWVFMSIAFPIDTYKHLLGVVGSYMCELFGAVCKLVCMALGTPFFLCKVFIVWLAYCIFVSCRLNYWLQYSNYLFILLWGSCDKYRTYNSVGSIKLSF